jgi:probable F420-dependent oxidoreductase
VSVDVGVLFPSGEIGDDPIAVRDFVQTAEDLGYSKLVVFDHVLGTPHEGRTPPLAGPYTERDPFHEAIVLLAYMAAMTSRIELMTGVLVLPQRQTAVVAKQVAELNWLSGGRVILGVGTGWNHVEYDALGVDFATRGDRLTEQVEVLRRLWSEPIVDYAGSFHRIDRAGVVPLPTRLTPIWFGGFGVRALRRAATIGDGYISGAPGHAHVVQLLEMLDGSGRSRDGFGLCEMASIASGPKVWEAQYEAWAAIGGTEMCVTTQAPGTAIHGNAPPAYSPSEHIAVIEDFARRLSL